MERFSGLVWGARGSFFAGEGLILFTGLVPSVGSGGGGGGEDDEGSGGSPDTSEVAGRAGEVITVAVVARVWLSGSGGGGDGKLMVVVLGEVS